MLKASDQLHELRDQACAYDSQHMVNSQELVIQTKSNSCVCKENTLNNQKHV